MTPNCAVSSFPRVEVWKETESNAPDAAARAEVERLAMEAVMSVEHALGFEPRDVSADNLGYDIESGVAVQAGEMYRYEIVLCRGLRAGT